MNSPASPNGGGYSVTFINVMRLLAAGCMFSGMYAAWAYDFTAQPGRLLVIASVGVALLGMMFVQQASKATPPAWANALLALFWVGVVGLIVLWVVTRFN
jgi:FtsH-binding integral membrane protein